MKFIDEIEVSAEAGDGGRGCMSFRREKFRPRCGPEGGDGGDGGDVVFVVDGGLGTLFDLTFQRHLRAKRGQHGRGKGCDGAAGADLVVRVPPGTLVTDVETGEVVADLIAPGDQAVVAEGGHGGRGNRHFASPTNQAPRRAEPGVPGQERRLRLELRVLADVGLLGKPNAGKSTLLRALSAARPRVAPYPFTTLTPHLGVVHHGDEDSFVVADIPGVIEGAHRGAGLGLRFLRHLARTAVLAHLVDASGTESTDPEQDYDAVNAELSSYGSGLDQKLQIVVATKLDLPDARLRCSAFQEALAKRGVPVIAVSAITGEGLAELVSALADAVRSARARTPPEPPVRSAWWSSGASDEAAGEVDGPSHS
jgi:GTP-binding protein